MHRSICPEIVVLAAPHNGRSEPTAAPHGEADQITYWIDPTASECGWIANDAPPDRQALQQAIHTCPRHAHDRQLRVSVRQRGDEPKDPEWHRKGEDGAQMPGRSRETGAS